MARRNSAAYPAADDSAESSGEGMNAGGPSNTPAPSRLRLPLGTMGHVKAELARLYRDAKAGRRDIADVSKLANVLSILGRLIEGTDTAAAIEAIEEELKQMRRK